MLPTSKVLKDRTRISPNENVVTINDVFLSPSGIYYYSKHKIEYENGTVIWKVGSISLPTGVTINSKGETFLPFPNGRKITKNSIWRSNIRDKTYIYPNGRVTKQEKQERWISNQKEERYFFVAGSKRTRVPFPALQPTNPLKQTDKNQTDTNKANSSVKLPTKTGQTPKSQGHTLRLDAGNKQFKNKNHEMDTIQLIIKQKLYSLNYDQFKVLN